MTIVPAAMLPLTPAVVVAGWPGFAVAFVVGACVGSFLNVCIHRIPAEESIVRPGSRCPRCATPIAWHDNVPVLSWLWLGARCRSCRARIAARYPLVELATGVIGVVALLAFGPSPRAAVAFAFTAALLLVSVIDLDHRFIPDEVSLPGVLVGLALAFTAGGRPSPLDAALGAALGGGVLWLVAWSYERLTGLEGMGLGDVKLLAMIGAFLGWQAIPAVLVIASITGSLAGFTVMFGARGRARGRRVRRRLGRRALLPFLRRAARRTEIPFGPFLALGAVIVLFFPAVALL
ncbi:MAG TPA: prepilin peptidase [Candidatus Binatia bacterium]|nr:prepilin peptidase [Candidatus Binatia bacterium]